MIPPFLDGFRSDCVSRMDFARTGLHWSVFLPAAELPKAAARLLDSEFTLEDVSVLDAAEGFLVCYHFDLFGRSSRLVLRVLLPHDAPRLPSLASIYSGAEWHERESRDFFGVEFEGNPNPIPLLLPAEFEGRPLVKAAPARLPLRKLVPTGEIVRRSPQFTLFPQPAQGRDAA